MNIEDELVKLIEWKEELDTAEGVVNFQKAKDIYWTQFYKIVKEFQRLQRCEEREAELEDALERCKRGDE